MIIHSIKWRLQAWHGFLLLCLVTGLMTGFYAYERRVRMQAVDNELLEAMTPLLPKLEGRETANAGADRRHREAILKTDHRRGSEMALGRPKALARHASSVRDRLQNVNCAVWPPRVSITSPGAPMEHRAPLQPTRRGRCRKPEFASAQPGRMLRTRGTYREVARVVPSGIYVVVGKSVATLEAELRRLALALAGIGGGIVVAGFAGGWWFATRALRPIADISQAAKEIAEGDLAKRINASETESELGQLATVLNSTFARLDAAFAQQQQFTSDAAHELRTPVAVILTQIQSTLNKERTPAEYLETLEACQRAAQRMRRLIESLLELARFDAGQAQLKRMPFDLAAVARDCADLVQPLAQERSIRISSELQPAGCQGGPERIGQVITNLLTNAVYYNRNGGEVRVATRRNGVSVVLTVTDTGPGIPPEQLSRIFDRFYRVDAARTSSQGRTGLGLAISRLIVEGHGGSISATNHPDGEAEFAVTLPLH